MKSRTFDTLTKSLHQDHLKWQEILEIIVSRFDCSTGTIHVLNKNSSLLLLQAYQGLPEFLIPKLEHIPKGKGMAGIAAEKLEPIELCNLQTDDSGTARAAAKESKVQGSIAVPMMLDNVLYGTLGIGKPVPYDFTEEEVAELMEIGKVISKVIATDERKVN